MAGRPPKVQVKFVRADDWRALPVSGARGGLTPDGHVYLSLYQELIDEPEPFIRDQETDVKDPVPDKNLIDTTREILVTAIMRPEVADSMAELLRNTAQAVRDAKPSGKKADK